MDDVCSVNAGKDKQALMTGLYHTSIQSLFMCFGDERKLGLGAREGSCEGKKEK